MKIGSASNVKRVATKQKIVERTRYALHVGRRVMCTEGVGSLMPIGASSHQMIGLFLMVMTSLLRMSWLWISQK